jgi:hypothetical protein
LFILTSLEPPQSTTTSLFDIIIIYYLFQKSTFGSTTFEYRTGHTTTYKICHT